MAIGRSGGFGGGGFARAVPSGGNFVARGGGVSQGFVARGAVGQNFAARGGPNLNRGGNWQGRRHFRGGPGFAYGVGVPYGYYDDSYYDYAAAPYGDDSCYQLQFIRGAWRQIWICE
jgi:hypothetical protein